MCDQMTFRHLTGQQKNIDSISVYKFYCQWLKSQMPDWSFYTKHEY